MKKSKYLNAICPACSRREIEIDGEKIKCSYCGREIKNVTEDSKKTANKIHIEICKLGIDVAAVGAGAIVSLLIPFAEPFAFTALGMVSQKAGEILGNLFEEKAYSPGTYGEQLAKKFESAYKEVYNTDNGNTSGKYQNFRNYGDYCCNHYIQVLSLLNDKNLSADVFSEEAIRTIISTENKYPGIEDDPQICENVISVAKILGIKYEQKILDDRNLSFRWHIEKNTKILDKVIEFLDLNADNDKIKLTDAEFEYIRNYNRPLFLEDNTNISLSKVYVDPIVEGTGKSITSEIYEWYQSDDEKILIVKGVAGIGKTSLVSRIIADTYGHSGFDNGLNKEEVFPIILRSNIDCFENASSNITPIAIIKDILGAGSEDIQNSLIILDGFDELCLLNPNFNPDLFLKKLNQELKSKNIKVLITSRPMEEIDTEIAGVQVKSIVWGEKQIKGWCEKFGEASRKESEKNWCKNFIDNYDELAKNDSDGNKMDIFKAPVILYLACHSDSQISANVTIGEFYDEVFRKIASRKHIENDDGCSVFMDNEYDEKANIINWQYTKELAYQMFLNDTLILSDQQLMENAEKRTIEVLKEKRPDIVADKENCVIDKLKYLAVTHFAKKASDESDKEDSKKIGIEFAHKTVYEYFTAVKLYEDYFAEITADYPTNTDINGLTSLEKVWTNIIEAFRYKSITGDNLIIFSYLNKMERPVYNGKAEDEGKGFYFNTFVKYFVEGMEQKILADLEIKKRVEEYIVRNDLLTTQISLAFHNLTWFLTGHGYHNEDDNDACKNFRELVLIWCDELNLNNWKLSGAKLFDADLTLADLIDTDLRGADLRGAKLIGANLRGADLSGAKYCREKPFITIFPDGFNPEEHDMIEVDWLGRPVKQSEKAGV